MLGGCFPEFPVPRRLGDRLGGGRDGEEGGSRGAEGRGGEERGGEGREGEGRGGKGRGGAGDDDVAGIT